MLVKKRNGNFEPVNFNKILKRVKSLSFSSYIDATSITQKVIQGLHDGVETTELDRLAAEISASRITIHYDYGTLAAHISISNLHKETKINFSDVMRDLYNDGIVSEKILRLINQFGARLNEAIIHERDYYFNYFGFKTLEKSYLLRINNKVVERPQYMFMRVAIEIHDEDIESAIETYNLMSCHYFIHATPTLFNAGTLKPQLSSCFLLTMKNSQLNGIMDTMKQCASISQNSGGIGLAVHNCSRLVPMLRVFNNLSRYVDQGKRPGAYTIYLEPWHVDIVDFLNMKKNTGNEEYRARDLFYALWVPDLFMERVQANKMWSLMSPKECPGLSKVWGLEFRCLYEKYEHLKKYKSQIRAQVLWRSIIDSQIATGGPFILYKDACNLKSNQRHLGTLQCSNLCTEIIQYSSPKEVSVCNLASIALNKFVKKDKKFDFEMLKKVTRVITRNLDKIIDINYYPIEEAKFSNWKHRPIGIGVQGLADTFLLMNYAFDSEDAKKLNKLIFETIYYAALNASCELAKKLGPYESFAGSPASKGILQFDLWKSNTTLVWDSLITKIKKFGLRNSLVTTVMPTASTAQILGNVESIEPFISNIYTRRVLSGEFQIINQYLLKYLIKKELWTTTLKNKIILAKGSIQDIEDIPEDIKKLYRTVWEIPQKSIIEMAADRAPFIDQSQSLNIHMSEPSFAKLSSMHFFGWDLGLKTGMYYLRTKSAVMPIQFTCESCSS